MGLRQRTKNYIITEILQLSKVYTIYIYGAYFKLQRWPTTSKFKGYLKITDAE